MDNFYKNKKAVERFLKEAGLYTAWKAYLSSKKITPTQAYSGYIHVDSVLGNSSFTTYLRKNAGLLLEYSISTVFRTYLCEVRGYNLCDFNLKILMNPKSKTTIDKHAGVVRIWDDANQKYI